MTWIPPESEAEWAETLSAYTDGELDADTAAALESHLIQDEKRTKQLESVRQTSELLQLWKVEAPVMNAALRDSIERSDKRTARPNRWRELWRIAAVFVAGVVTGAVMMNARQDVNQGAPVIVAAEDSRQDEVVISSDRADVLLKEVAATDLRRRIEQDAAQSRWKDAHEGVERMRSHYADTNAAKKLADGPIARRFLRRLLDRSS